VTHSKVFYLVKVSISKLPSIADAETVYSSSYRFCSVKTVYLGCIGNIKA